MKSSVGSSTSLRFVIGGLLAAVACYFLYEVVVISKGSAPLPKCDANPAMFKLVQVYKGDGTLELSMYTFETDPISSAVLAHSRNGALMSGESFHKFYAEHLCQGHRCRGIVLDVGAFIGTHSLVLAKLGFHVHSFEIQIPAVQLLRCSVNANKLYNMRVHQQALSNQLGEECVLTPMASLAHTAMIAPKLPNNRPIECEQDTKVPVTTLDHYWKNTLNSAQVLYIKIDVQGHEDHVLEGGKEMLQVAPPPFIMMQYYPRALKLKGVTTEEVLKRVASYGYRVYDCVHEVEVPNSSEGVGIMESFFTADSPEDMTELLLVHKTHNITMADLSCGG